MLIILAVVTCASILEAAGGLKYMLQVAERMLRKNPKRVTLIAPFVTYTMTFMLGTGHAVYSIMPIIGDVALKMAFVLSARWQQHPLRRKSPLPPRRFRLPWSTT